jgi:hypothetical protein
VGRVGQEAVAGAQTALAVDGEPGALVADIIDEGGGFPAMATDCGRNPAD